MEDTTRIALAKKLADTPKLAPGTYFVDETVTLRVRGTIKVQASTSAKEPLPWKQIAAMAWGRLSVQDRLNIIEAVNGPGSIETAPAEQELDAAIIREMKPRAGATTATVVVEDVMA